MLVGVTSGPGWSLGELTCLAPHWTWAYFFLCNNPTTITTFKHSVPDTVLSAVHILTHLKEYLKLPPKWFESYAMMSGSLQDVKSRHSWWHCWWRRSFLVKRKRKPHLTFVSKCLHTSMRWCSEKQQKLLGNVLQQGLLHHAPFIVPAHGTWPRAGVHTGLLHPEHVPLDVLTFVMPAVGSVNVCWMQVLRVVSLLVCSLFEERGVFWKGASCQGRRSYLEKV